MALKWAPGCYWAKSLGVPIQLAEGRFRPARPVTLVGTALADLTHGSCREAD